MTEQTETQKLMTTYGVLGMLFDEHLKDTGQRKPDEVQLQFYESNWRLWGGDEYPEPKPIGAGGAYLIACESPGIDEQEVIDTTFKQVKQLKMKMLNLRGKAREVVEAQWNKLRDELEEARQYKKARQG